MQNVIWFISFVREKVSGCRRRKTRLPENVNIRGNSRGNRTWDSKEVGPSLAKRGEEHSPTTSGKMRAKPVLCTFSPYSNSRVLPVEITETTEGHEVWLCSTCPEWRDPSVWAVGGGWNPAPRSYVLQLPPTWRKSDSLLIWTKMPVGLVTAMWMEGEKTPCRKMFRCRTEGQGATERWLKRDMTSVFLYFFLREELLEHLSIFKANRYWR